MARDMRTLGFYHVCFHTGWIRNFLKGGETVGRGDGSTPVRCRGIKVPVWGFGQSFAESETKCEITVQF